MPGLDQLLAAVYAAPEDDQPRLVYSDALLERGDPRGELIALQAELLAAHQTRWLGALEPFITHARFERGFLASCRIHGTDLARRRAIAEHPAWSTVQDLSGSPLIGLHPARHARVASDEGFEHWLFAAAQRDAPVPVLHLTFHQSTATLTFRLERGERGYERVAILRCPRLRPPHGTRRSPAISARSSTRCLRA